MTEERDPWFDEAPTEQVGRELCLESDKWLARLVAAAKESSDPEVRACFTGYVTSVAAALKLGWGTQWEAKKIIKEPEDQQDEEE